MVAFGLINLLLVTKVFVGSSILAIRISPRVFRIGIYREIELLVIWTSSQVHDEQVIAIHWAHASLDLSFGDIMHVRSGL